MTIVNMVGGASQEIKTAQFDGYLELNKVTSITRATKTVVVMSNDTGYFNSDCTIQYSDGMLAITQQKPITLIRTARNNDTARCYVASSTATSPITNDHNLSTYLKAACPVGKRFTALIEGYLGALDSSSHRTVALYETTDSTYDTLNAIVSGYKSVYSFTATGDNATCTYPTDIPASVCSGVGYYQVTPSGINPAFVITRITYEVS